MSIEWDSGVLIGTERDVTLEAVAKEIDFNNKCEIEYFVGFVKWVLEVGFGKLRVSHAGPGDILLSNDVTPLKYWYCTKLEVLEWLVIHGFAMEDPRFSKEEIDKRKQREVEKLEEEVRILKEEIKKIEEKILRRRKEK